MRKRGSEGFTIVELMIATAVFSVILLAATVGFIQIGHLFYKGVSVAQTQNVANQIFQDINGNFQTAANISATYDAPGGYDYYCVGNNRYTYILNNQVDANNNPDNHSPQDVGGNFGILKDTLPGGSACAAPCDDISGNNCPAGTVKFSNPVELLGSKMRVEAFDITQSTTTSNLYNVSLVIAYGDDDVLNYSNPKDWSTVSCTNDPNSQQFCSVSRVQTAVYRGWHQ